MEDNPYFVPCELSPELLKDLLPVFFEEVRADYEVLLQFLDQKDHHPMSQGVHKIKGTALSYGAQGIHQAAIALEEALKSNKTNELEQLINALNFSIKEAYHYAKSHLMIRG